MVILPSVLNDNRVSERLEATRTEEQNLSLPLSDLPISCVFSSVV